MKRLRLTQGCQRRRPTELRRGTIKIGNERIDKILAFEGFGSRKEVRGIVRGGGVAVNGEPVLRPEQKVDPEEDKIEIWGKRLQYKRWIYLMMNKPKGVITASRDSSRRTVLDLVPMHLQRQGLFPAGRLDRDTEGLLILTNDGAFAHRMTSPSKKVYKYYDVVVEGVLTQEHVEAFAQGILLADGTVCKEALMRIDQSGERSKARVVLSEGKYHQIKRMFGVLQRPVLSLRRVQIGALCLDRELESGACREMTEEERKKIWNRAVEL